MRAHILYYYPLSISTRMLLLFQSVYEFRCGGARCQMILFFKCDRLCVKTSMILCTREKQRECVCMEGFIVLSQYKKCLLRNTAYVTTTLRQIYYYSSGRIAHTHTHTIIISPCTHTSSEKEERFTPNHRPITEIV